MRFLFCCSLQIRHVRQSQKTSNEVRVSERRMCNLCEGHSSPPTQWFHSFGVIPGKYLPPENTLQGTRTRLWFHFLSTFFFLHIPYLLCIFGPVLFHTLGSVECLHDWRSHIMYVESKRKREQKWWCFFLITYFNLINIHLNWTVILCIVCNGLFFSKCINPVTQSQLFFSPDWIPS